MAEPAKAEFNKTDRCPICRRLAQPACRPFCSPRCADVDLGRWITGQYVVPGDPADPDDIPPEAPAGGA